MDLRPENIMIQDRNMTNLTFKLIDFGLLEKRPYEFDDTLKLVAEYRAPEIFVGYNYDEAVDIWYLCATCVRVLTERHVFGLGCRFEDPNFDRQVVS